jgi:hypothetical protein
MCNDVTSGTAVPTVLIDNERTRVTEWRFAGQGDNTGWHRHEYDYIVVPTADGVLEILDAEGNITQSELKTGVPYFRQKGVEHDVMNGNDREYAFVEIELLEPSTA